MCRMQVREYLETVLFPGSVSGGSGGGGGTRAQVGAAAAADAPAAARGQKIVLFAHHKTVMNQLQVLLEEHFSGVAVPACVDRGAAAGGAGAIVPAPQLPSTAYVRIDGSTDHRARMELQQRFHNDPSCNVRGRLLSGRVTKLVARWQPRRRIWCRSADCST
jgi:hypothetical protein